MMEFVDKTIGELSCEQILLPVGWINENGERKRFCTMGEMNGEVEEAIANPKIKDNAGKIITEFLFKMLLSMDGEKKVSKDAIRKLTTIDRDYLIVMSHKTSFGDTVKWVDKCTNCKATNDITININDLKVRFLPTEFDSEFSFELPRPVIDKGGNECKDVTICLPNGWTQERLAPIFRTNPAQATTALIQAVTQKLGSLEMPIDVEIFQKMSSKNRNAINKYMEDMELGVDVKVTEICSECGEQFETIIPMQALMGE